MFGGHFFLNQVHVSRCVFSHCLGLLVSNDTSCEEQSSKYDFQDKLEQIYLASIE
jgi:hypothetical protein